MDSSEGFDLGGVVVISGPDAYLPKESSDLKQPKPGDLSRFLEQGDVRSFHRPRSNDPLKSSPDSDACGGTIYFGCGPAACERLRSLLMLLDVRPSSNDHAVFVAHSQNPNEDGYLTQLRFVPRYALQYGFGSISGDEYDGFPMQETTIEEGLLAFIRHENERWGTRSSPKLEVLFDRDNAGKEHLGFGFMLENAYYRVCRIWSRSWVELP